MKIGNKKIKNKKVGKKWWSVKKKKIGKRVWSVKKNSAKIVGRQKILVT